MAIKISGDTIIDDSRVIVNADKIGIGTTNPHVSLEISNGDVGIGTTNPNAEVLNTNTSKLAVGIVTANTIFGNLVGGITDTGDVTITGDLTVNDNTTIGSNADDTVTFNAKSSNIIPQSNKNLGSSSNKWSNVYATTFNGDLTGDVTGNADTATSATSATTATNATNATNATKAYVTETNTDTVTRGIVFCDAANNASGNKDLKYDRNLAYDPTGNRIIVNEFQGNTVNVGAIKLGGSNGSSGQYVRSTGSGAEWANFPSGNIEPAIEVTQRTTTDFVTTSTSYQTAITTTIDPVDSGSTLLIVAGGIMAGYRQDDYDDPEKSSPLIQLYRGSTAIGEEMSGSSLTGGSVTGYYRTGFNLTFKDTTNHSGNSVTYYLKLKRNSNSDHQNVAIYRGTTLTVQEII